MSSTPSDTEPTQKTTEQPSDAGTTQKTTEHRDRLNTDMMQWVSALAALAGLGLVAAPFVFEATDTATWNNTITGTAIFLTAGYNFYRLSKDRLASVGAAALAALLGVWALVSPYVIEMGSSELARTTMGLGVIIAALSAYNAYANSKADTTERTAHHT